MKKGTNFCKRRLLLTKLGSGILSLNWNLSPVSTEAKVPRNRKNSRGPAQSNVKQLTIFTYDCKGVIMTDRVPSGTTVTAAYCCQFLQKLRRNMQVNKPDLLENGILILHDNARPQIGKVVRELLDRYRWEVLPWVVGQIQLGGATVNCWTDTAGRCYRELLDRYSWEVLPWIVGQIQLGGATPFALQPDISPPTSTCTQN